MSNEQLKEIEQKLIETNQLLQKLDKNRLGINPLI